jgi:hypothetical protein
MLFDEVQVQHFSSISRDPFPHVLIERALIQIGGGEKGTQFKNDVLAAAGWTHSALTPFGKYPEQACMAWNRVRAVLAETEDPATILERLRQK